MTSDMMSLEHDDQLKASVTWMDLVTMVQMKSMKLRSV